jgi:RNA-binding protein Musashi
MEAKQEQEPRMFVGGLYPETTSDTVKAYFSQFGNVIEVKIIGEKQKRSRGFGFVLFEKYSTLELAMTQRHKIEGRDIDCNLAVYSNNNTDEAS